MTVICPSCDARFRDPPADVPAGRSLQCSKCEHEWLPIETAPRIQVDAPALDPQMSDLIAGDEDAIKTALPVVMPGDLNKVKSEPTYVDRALVPIAKKSVRATIGMLGIACLSVAAGSVIFKSAIMAQLPQTVALYQAAGLASSNPGLEIANVVTTKSSRDGIAQLIVKGEIENIATNTVPVPPIKLIMRGESNANLYAWTVSAAKGELKAGEKSRFTAVAHNFPGGAVNVEVEFAPLKGQRKSD